VVFHGLHDGVMWLVRVVLRCYGGAVVAGSPTKVASVGSDVVHVMVRDEECWLCCKSA